MMPPSKCLAAAACLLATATALGQTYPAKPIRFIVPFGVGGPSDVTARIMAEALAPAMGQPVLVENRPAADGIVGVELAARAKPDGYTILIVAQATAVNMPFLYAKLPFDTEKDFEPVILVNRFPFLLMANADLGVNNLGQFLALAKSKPLFYGTSGSGTMTNLSMVRLARITGFKATEVPYKSNAEISTALAAGHIHSLMGSPVTAMQAARTARAKVLATASPVRDRAFPDVPTFAEAGVPGFEASSWYGIMAPAGLPGAISARLNAEMNRVLKLPDVIDRMQKISVEPAGGSAAEFAGFLKGEREKWGSLITELNLRQN